MRYVLARLEEYSLSKSYRIYVTDSLSAIAKNTKTRIVGRDVVDCGVELSKRWCEVISDTVVNEPEDERSCEEIVSEIWKKAGFKREVS